MTILKLFHFLWEGPKYEIELIADKNRITKILNISEGIIDIAKMLGIEAKKYYS